MESHDASDGLPFDMGYVAPVAAANYEHFPGVVVAYAGASCQEEPCVDAAEHSTEQAPYIPEPLEAAAGLHTCHSYAPCDDASFHHDSLRSSGAYVDGLEEAPDDVAGDDRGAGQHSVQEPEEGKDLGGFEARRFQPSVHWHYYQHDAGLRNLAPQILVLG